MTAFNEFVIRFANVNGSGSASANGMFAKVLFRMGVPVGIRNVFPSNIQGLPTWFEVRVSEKGFLGRREVVDIMVAMNAQTYAQDVLNLKPDGFLVFDNSKGCVRELDREDVRHLGIPITRLLQPEFSDPRQRHLFKNIVYVGALSALLNIDFDLLTAMVSEQFRGKQTLIRPNIRALRIGREYAKEFLDCPLPIQVRHSDAVGDSILVDGNTAAALGCIYGGATVCAWYPITPSTSMAEAFERRASRLRVDPETKERRFAVIQAEDELSAIGIVIGAGWNGARAFTATSGPGLSLMNEFLGLAYFAEIPTVLFDIQRAGPSTGMPTRTQQSDVLSAAYASHGDTKHPLLFPSTPKECFDFAAEALDLAEELQTPIIVLSDLDIGMNESTSEPLEWDENRKMNRGKVLDTQQLENWPDFGRYIDVDGDGIGYRTLPGAHPSKGAFFTRGSSRDERAVYTEDPEAYVGNMDRLLKKWETAKSLVPAAEISDRNADVGLIFYGSTHAAIKEAVELLQSDGVAVDHMRIRAFPFGPEVGEFLDNHSVVYLVEQNRDAQLKTLLVNELAVDPLTITSVLHYGGMSIPATYIADEVIRLLEESRFAVAGGP